jgi:hypothetical protein
MNRKINIRLAQLADTLGQLGREATLDAEAALGRGETEAHFEQLGESAACFAAGMIVREARIQQTPLTELASSLADLERSSREFGTALGAKAFLVARQAVREIAEEGLA